MQETKYDAQTRNKWVNCCESRFTCLQGNAAKGPLFVSKPNENSATSGAKHTQLQRAGHCLKKAGHNVAQGRKVTPRGGRQCPQESAAEAATMPAQAEACLAHPRTPPQSPPPAAQKHATPLLERAPNLLAVAGGTLAARDQAKQRTHHARCSVLNQQGLLPGKE